MACFVNTDKVFPGAGRADEIDDGEKVLRRAMMTVRFVSKPQPDQHPTKHRDQAGATLRHEYLNCLGDRRIHQ